MDSKSDPRVKSDAGSKKGRHLTIAYYVDPRSMHRMTIPLGRANVIVSAVMGAVVWTIGTAIYVGFHLSGTAGAGMVTGPAVASLGESVRMVTAPAPVVAVAAEKAREEVRPAWTEESMIPAEDVPPSHLPFEEKVAVAEAEEIEALPLPKAPKHLEKVMLSPLQVASANGELSAKFSIYNKMRTKASGKVWGVASFIEASGETVLVASAPGIDTAIPEGSVSVEAAPGFSANRLTNKELKFKAPDGIEGRFVQLKIFVKQDHDNNLVVSEQELAD